MNRARFNALALILGHDKDNTSDEESVGEDDDGLQVELNAKLSDAVDEIGNLHEELAAQRQADQTRREGWDAYETQSDRRMELYEKENTTLRTGVAELTNRISLATDKCTLLTSELEQQKEKMNEAETKARNLEHDFTVEKQLTNAQQQENQKLRQDWDAYKKQTKQFASVNITRELELADLKQANKTLTRKQRVASDQYSQASAIITNLQTELKDHDRTKEENQTLKRASKSREHELTAAKARTKKLIDHCAAQGYQWKEKLKEAETKARNLEHDFTAEKQLWETERRTQTETINEAKTEAARLEQANKTLERAQRINTAREQAEGAIMAYRISCLGDDSGEKQKTHDAARKCIAALDAVVSKP